MNHSQIERRPKRHSPPYQSRSRPSSPSFDGLAGRVSPSPVGPHVLSNTHTIAISQPQFSGAIKPVFPLCRCALIASLRGIANAFDRTLVGLGSFSVSASLLAPQLAKRLGVAGKSADEGGEEEHTNGPIAPVARRSGRVPGNRAAEDRCREDEQARQLLPCSPQPAGWMLWLTWKRLCGSNFCLIEARRE